MNERQSGSQSESLSLFDTGSSAAPLRLPSSLRRTIPSGGGKRKVERILAACGVPTVCAEAKCPNRAECFCRGTATFMIMGTTCTRTCTFCGVTHGTPAPLDPGEPERVAAAARQMGLRHVVITSVTRDDLPGGGASHFAATVASVRHSIPSASIEVLVPDFGGDREALYTVLQSRPDIFNHNVETVPRLYPRVRPQADYRRSLEILLAATRFDTTRPTKSGLMVGLGERESEVEEVMQDLRGAGCTILTIGQYLRPSRENIKVEQFIEESVFESYRRTGEAMGLAKVFAGVFVRSSYRAEEMADAAHRL
jgi:lipoic acid synthetase